MPAQGPGRMGGGCRRVENRWRRAGRRWEGEFQDRRMDKGNVVESERLSADPTHILDPDTTS